MVLIGVFIFFIILIIFLKKSKYVHKNKLLFDFIATTVATLIGVVMAVNLSVSKEEEKEKEDLIKILKSTSSILNRVESIAEAKYKVYRDNIILEKQDTTSIKKRGSILPYFDFLEKLLNEKDIIKNLSEIGLQNLGETHINISSNYGISDINYIILLEHLNEVIKFELQFQQEKLEYVALKDSLSSANNRMLKKLRDKSYLSFSNKLKLD